MSGFQEILVIVFIIVAIMFIPRMTARPPSANPSRRAAVRMGGKTRLAVAFCAVYMAAAAAYFQPWRRDFLLFLCVGVGPVALAGIVAWVVAGFRKQ